MVVPNPRNLHESVELHRISTMSSPVGSSPEDAVLEPGGEELVDASFLPHEAPFSGGRHCHSRTGVIQKSLTPPYSERRRLLFRLGASFFLFGLINNSMSLCTFASNLFITPLKLPFSALRNYFISSAGPRAPIYSKGDHNILQHYTPPDRQSRLAVRFEGANTLP